MDDQYVMLGPPVDAPPPPAPPRPDVGDATLLETKTNLKTEVNISADPSAMPEAPDFGGGQSAYTNPMPPIDSKSLKDTGTEKTDKKRSVMCTAIFGALTAIFLIIAVVGGLGVAGLFKKK